MPTNDGGAITRETVFDKFSVSLVGQGSLQTSGRAYLYSGGERIGYVRTRESAAGHRLFAITDPEIIEIQRRLDAGEVGLYFEHGQYFPPYELHAWADLQETLWYVATVFPFHERGVDPHHFFDALARGADLTPATERMPQLFHVPGLVVDQGPRTYYKRQDGAEAPDVRAVIQLSAEGWMPTPPYGPHHLHSIEVTEMMDGAVTVETPRRVHFRRPDDAAALRAVALEFHNWWSSLTSGERGINVRQTIYKHMTHAIGRVWDAMPLDDDVRYFPPGSGTTRTRSARDAADWYLGNLEQWAFQWGFGGMALVLNVGSNRALLNAQLDDYVFCHVNVSGTVGEQLANPNSGIAPADWEAWGTTHYNAALGTVVKAVAGDDAIIPYAQTHTLGGADVVTNPDGTTTYAWELVSGEGGTLSAADVAQPTLTAPVLVATDAPRTLVYRKTVTNNGVTDVDEVTIQVAPPMLLLPSANIPVVAGATATHQLGISGGLGPYVYAAVQPVSWVTIDSDGEVMIAPPADTAAETYLIRYSVTDASNTTVSGYFQVTVSASE